LPKAPAKKNGKRIACIGAGPATLTVANDLMPLGYEVTIFEKMAKPGGLMRTNIPRFRLPEAVLDEEIASVIDMGVDVRFSSPVKSFKSLLSQGYDAVFVGSGAPKGKELDIPGRKEADEAIQIGIAWLESVAFGHVTSIPSRIVIIGAGNTAMDCCRTAKRLGGTDVKVVARGPRAKFKASPWELHDAEEEQVAIIENHSPHSFVLQNGKLTGIKFERAQASGKGTEIVEFPCDMVILAIGQENAFPWIERDIGIEFNKWDMPIVDEATHASTRPDVFFGGDAAWGPKNIIWAVAHGHQAAISIHQFCQGKPVTERPPLGMTLTSQKMGIHEWSFDNDFDPARRTEMVHVNLAERFASLSTEVEVGFDAKSAAREVARCLNCDIQTKFAEKLCIECDACVDICPTQCLTMAPNGEESDLRGRLTAPSVNHDQPLYVSNPLVQTARVMVKDENLCVHCGLCAERCPTAAWDMMKSEFQLPKAGNLNG
jgi:NADPH-dependent glutamate synthase beta subunit-like oxidoreductase